MLFNVADKYVLQLSGFPLDRITEFDNIFLHIEESLYIHVCSLAEPIQLSDIDFPETLVPLTKLAELQEQINNVFPNVCLKARQTF